MLTRASSNSSRHHHHHRFNALSARTARFATATLFTPHHTSTHHVGLGCVTSPPASPPACTHALAPDTTTVIGRNTRGGQSGGGGGARQGPTAYERAKAVGAITENDRKGEWLFARTRGEMGVGALRTRRSCVACGRAARQTSKDVELVRETGLRSRGLQHQLLLCAALCHRASLRIARLAAASHTQERPLTSLSSRRRHEQGTQRRRPRTPGQAGP
jgi:hypothetical protein